MSLFVIIAMKITRNFDAVAPTRIVGGTQL
jgi:hypothetical protein